MINIKLDVNILNYMQCVQYDKDNLEFLISKLSLKHVSKEDMDYWKQEYLKAAKELRIAKNFITSTFIESNDSLINKKNIRWNINFNTGELEVSWDEDTSN